MRTTVILPPSDPTLSTHPIQRTTPEKLDVNAFFKSAPPKLAEVKARYDKSNRQIDSIREAAKNIPLAPIRVKRQLTKTDCESLKQTHPELTIFFAQAPNITNLTLLSDAAAQHAHRHKKLK